MLRRGLSNFASQATDQVGYVSTKDFNFVCKKLRTFFDEKGFLEAHLQSRQSILAACEDVATVATYDYRGLTWPLPQTNQMWLEYEILKNPNVPGYYCLTTSYRNEPNPIPGRHDVIFPMFEIEFPGDMKKLETIWEELLAFLGYPKPVHLEYDDAAHELGVDIIESRHEEQLAKKYGPDILLKNFPLRTNPFFNMKLHPDGQHSKKIDVLLSGYETFGSAERSTCVRDMRHMFDTISNGEYAGTLYRLFGKDRVEDELQDYLSYPQIQRSGAGIGIKRLIRSLKMEGLME